MGLLFKGLWFPRRNQLELERHALGFIDLQAASKVGWFLGPLNVPAPAGADVAMCW